VKSQVQEVRAEHNFVEPHHIHLVPERGVVVDKNSVGDHLPLEVGMGFELEEGVVVDRNLPKLGEGKIGVGVEGNWMLGLDIDLGQVMLEFAITSASF
jgi:hypothetical protein